MKPNILLVIAAATIDLSVTSGAFPPSAVGYEGGELSPNPYSVFVPDYGELIFETASIPYLRSQKPKSGSRVSGGISTIQIRHWT
jgi:hypothetical protein